MYYITTATITFSFHSQSAILYHILIISSAATSNQMWMIPRMTVDKCEVVLQNEQIFQVNNILLNILYTNTRSWNGTGIYIYLDKNEINEKM